MRLDSLLNRSYKMLISIHAPLTGCDNGSGTVVKLSGNFNPRTPYGMRQYRPIVERLTIDISIHAPLTGCDFGTFANNVGIAYFNPRTPYGMRPY